MASRAIDYELTPAGYQALGDPADTRPARQVPGGWHPMAMRDAVYHLTDKALAELDEPPEQTTP